MRLHEKGGKVTELRLRDRKLIALGRACKRCTIGLYDRRSNAVALDEVGGSRYRMCYLFGTKAAGALDFAVMMEW